MAVEAKPGWGTWSTGAKVGVVFGPVAGLVFVMGILLAVRRYKNKGAQLRALEEVARTIHHQNNMEAVEEIGRISRGESTGDHGDAVNGDHGSEVELSVVNASEANP